MCCRIQRVDGVLQLDAEAIVDVELARLHDQALGNSAWMRQSRVSFASAKVAARNRLANPHVVELGGLRRKADLDVALTLSISQLSKGHDAELLGACKRLHIPVATMSLDDA